MKKRGIVIAVAAVLVVAILIALGAWYAARQRVERRRVFRAATGETKPKPPSAEVRPVAEWSEQFRSLEAAGRWRELDELLDKLETQQPDAYAQNGLAYLHARARLENGDTKAAAQKLAPFVAPGSPFRDLALYHQSEIDTAEAASAHRTELIFGAPNALYRDEALDDETAYRASLPDPKPLLEFASRLYASAPTARRRDLDAHIVESLMRTGDANGALARGLALLHAGTMDDPSDRVSRALDRPELLRRMNAQQWVMLGDAMRNHRHFDRAVAILSMALGGAPPAQAAMIVAAPKKKAAPKNKPAAKAPPKPTAAAPAAPAAIDRNDLLFSIGRSHFGAERYAQAQQTYLRGANETRDLGWKCTFLWHAARAAQLQNDDATAERLMTQAIAVPGRFASTAAALTQRMRTRLKQKRVSEAAADLNAIRAGWPHDHAVVEASLGWSIYMIAMGNDGAALSCLNSIPRALCDKYDVPELDYWRARALERTNPHAAFETYLSVLRATVPTHFAYFARARLESQAMASRVAQELTAREQQVAQLLAAKKFDDAKRAETDRILLSSRNRAAELQRLTNIYDQLPAYRNILHLEPAATPAFPLPANADRASKLMAMGLFDEAVDEIPRRYPLHPTTAALTQSLALNRGNASKESIFAIEVLMNSVPGDYLPDLLPMSVRQLLYPRYFFDFISEDAKKFEADPTLVLSIMREESRFNPRAKSEAAARGLLQFIITTARDIGRNVGLVDVQPEDLYDPRVIIRLGAKYISELTQKFGGDRYKAAGAYNAGPNQVALWSRLAPAAGEDFFLSSVNFDETKHYIRKVMNSYARYSEIYGGAGPVGGVRAEP